MKPRRQSLLRPAGQIQPQPAVHPVHPLVVPPVTSVMQSIEALPEAPAPVSFDHPIERIDHRRITLRPVDSLPVIRRPRELCCSAGPGNRQTMLLDHDPRCLPAFRRRYSFRFSTALIASFSSARSAYIFFSRAFSASSSRRRFNSETLKPPYFAFQL